MRDTKRKILDKSLELFNERGSENTTVRHIAAALNMSHGNLCYHFANTDVIVEALYDELVQRLSDKIQEMQVSEISVFTLIKLTEATFPVFFDYRFIMLEFVFIMRRFERINQHFRQLQARRNEEFRMLFAMLQEKGYMKPEPAPGRFDKLIELMMLVGNFWMSEGEVLHKGDKTDQVRHYTHLFGHLLLPYLTDKGLTEFDRYFGSGS